MKIEEKKKTAQKKEDLKIRYTKVVPRPKWKFERFNFYINRHLF